MDGVSPAPYLARMPLPAPLPMPVQDLGACPPPTCARTPDGAAPIRRLVLAGAGAIALCLVGSLLLWAWPVLSPLHAAIILTSGAVAFWIALSAMTALVGLLTPVPAPKKEAGPAMTVAILLPVYHEPPLEVTANALAMLRDLSTRRTEHRFSLFILSDTRGDAFGEEEAVARLSALAPYGIPVHYRRRDQNTDRKIGNIGDWLRRWGGAYEAMVVLDADSLMGGRTLVAMADALAADPRAGLIQTSPQIIAAKGLFARAQAFACSAYGPLLGRGLSRWAGDSANFWGHNAILRTRAFASSAGLPHLPRWDGGSSLIWSHDFVEAALMRRRGWKIRLRSDLGESFEETPPSLIDHILRDRRWCQGNLQHLRLLRTPGLDPVSRLHLAQGAAGYLMSPAWGLLLVLWATLCFTTDGTPPGWGVLILSYALLLVPRLLGLARLLSRPSSRGRFGGGPALLAGAMLEFVFSVLVAPCFMVQQSLAIGRILLGRTVGWSPQNRHGGGYSWRSMAEFHLPETVLGLTLSALVLWGTLPVLLAPLALGLLLTVPLSAASTSTGLARWLRTPHDRRPSMIHRQALMARDDLCQSARLPMALAAE